MRKIFSFIMAVVMISMSVCISCYAAEETENAEGVLSLSSDNSVNDYLSDEQLEKLTCENIKIELGGVKADKEPIRFDVQVNEEGAYSVGMRYKALEEKTDKIKFSLKIDGNYPYESAKTFELPRMWCDEDGGKRKDTSGNEFAAQQIVYKDYYYNSVIDETLKNGYKFYIYLSTGKHTVEITSRGDAFEIDYFQFEATSGIEKYTAPNDESEFYIGKPYVIEAESAVLKSDYYLVGKSDSSTVDITPNNPSKNLINYIGGGNWKTIGDTIVLETPELEAGYYNLGFTFRQNAVIGGRTYRSLTVDGESLFAESEVIGFDYDDNWQNSIFSDEKGNPYAIYLSKGSHKLAFSVVPGDIGEVRNMLTDAVAKLGSLYIDITMITGETVDTYRDYDLFTQISDMEKRLNEIKSLLDGSAKRLLEINGQDSGSDYSIIKNMVEIINQMLKNKFEAHKYKDSYYTNYCSVSSVLQDLRNMPLDLDKVILFSPNDKKPFVESGFLEQVVFSVKRFFISFVRDYNAISAANEGKSITIWVNWGRDQAQVLSALNDRSFTPDTGISVNLQLVNASVVQAVLSGNGPDCILQHTRSEPVNLAMRGVLYDLSKFDDCNEVLKRFQKGADIPYRYKDGLYALPDTQTFFMMFYRKDILDQFGIKVPSTWEEFDEAAKLLIRNNMSVWLPNNVAMSTTEVNVGIGSVNIFPSLLLQNGLSLYTEDKKSTNLLSSDVMEVFEKWTDYYCKQKFPKTLDFYNRLRIGITPIGIAPYTTYTTLMVAAPEIEGLWNFTAIPGTLRADGTVCRASSGGGTACAILSGCKNVDNAWEYLKWWTSAKTQVTYSRDVESILGPAGRVALSNIEAIKGLSWADGMLDELLNAWEQVEEIPECPGSYYVTRSVYQSFWNVVNANKNTKDTLMKYGKEANDEMSRKWKQYQNR